MFAMATVNDVQRIALSLPETDEHPSYGGRPAYRVREKGFVYLREDGESIVVFVSDQGEKEAILASNAKKFFTTPHYDGYNTVLVRYKHVGVRELRELITDSWRIKAPKRVLAEFEANEKPRAARRTG
jgi:hypothetical protein